MKTNVAVAFLECLVYSFPERVAAIKPTSLISLVSVVLAVLLVVLNHVANYWLGYSETEFASLAIDPIVGVFLELAIFAYLFFAVVLSFFVKPLSRWPLYSFAAYWPLVILTWYCLGRPGPLLAHGLRDRVMHDYTLNDLRQFRAGC